MEIITLVTGNPGKLAEYQALLPEDTALQFVSHDVDLEEIQSMDLQAIVRDKLERAYAVVKAPVIVEDVAAGLDDLHGLPGPFFKFFEVAMGPTALLQLAKKVGQKATITCTAGYYDGKTMLFAEGVLHATIVEPRGTSGFGFDQVVVPDGHEHTFAEMGPKQKNRISHRGIACKSLLEQIVAHESLS